VADAFENRVGAESAGELAHALDGGIAALADDVGRTESACSSILGSGGSEWPPSSRAKPRTDEQRLPNHDGHAE
jgi:hypothetical protein